MTQKCYISNTRNIALIGIYVADVKTVRKHCTLCGESKLVSIRIGITLSTLNAGLNDLWNLYPTLTEVE
jgi:hypothetical protein